jgi:hypothetical protein
VPDGDVVQTVVVVTGTVVVVVGAVFAPVAPAGVVVVTGFAVVVVVGWNTLACTLVTLAR